MEKQNDNQALPLQNNNSSVNIGDVYSVASPQTESQPQNVQFVKESVDRTTGEAMYYAHYLGQDNRLDEWISRATIQRHLSSNNLVHVAPGDTPLGHGLKRARDSDVGMSIDQFSNVDNLNEKVNMNYGDSEARLARGMSFDFTPGIALQKLRRKDKSMHESKANHVYNKHDSKLRNINKVQFGDWEVACWYFSAYPFQFTSNPIVNRPSIQISSERDIDPSHSGYTASPNYLGGSPSTIEQEIEDCFIEKLYICDKSFKYMRKPKTYWDHLQRTSSFTSPADVCNAIKIYSHPKTQATDPQLEVYQIDGGPSKQNILFCQNLCLFSKLFIEHKNITYNPEPFTFYLLIERFSDTNWRSVGYFSVEKNAENNNLSCILVFPPYQDKGYGRLLISLSYEISKAQQPTIPGGPERPLSDLGKIGYRSFWSFTILNLLHIHGQRKSPMLSSNTEITGRLHGIGLKEISTFSGMRGEDILSTLAYMGFIRQTKGGLVVVIDDREVEKKLQRYKDKKYEELLCKQEFLNLEPPLIE